MPRRILFVSLPGLSEAVNHPYIQMSDKEINFWFLQKRIPSQKRTSFEHLCLGKLSKIF